MLGTSVAGDGGVGGDEVPLEQVEAEICELAGHLAAGECRWLGCCEAGRGDAGGEHDRVW